ncbi:MAG: sugar phosphate isomerase/epimerase [Chloroflexi bacterium]|nr:sugar phosphate isomerase/epimerase [Chloroflexota bacterium]
MKISLASKVLQDRSPEDVIDVASTLGFAGVEWFCLPQHLPPETSSKQAAALGARTRDAGLKTVCLSTYAGGFADLPDAECERQIGIFQQYVRIAEQFGCTLLRIWPDDMGRRLLGPVTEEHLERAAQYIRQAADRAAERGMRVAVEMHQTIGVDTGRVIRLLDLIDRPNAGVIYDPGNVYLARLPYAHETVRPLAGRIMHVQLKDAHLGLPTPAHLASEPALRYGGSFDLLTGEGEVDFRQVASALREAGYDGWCSVECHALPRPEMDSVAIAAAELASIRQCFELPAVEATASAEAP